MSLDLFLADVPPRRRSAALFDQLRQAMVDGRLAAGDRLPPTRELAAELGLSRSTITTVYGRLVAEGHAEGRPGDGTYVASPLGVGRARPAARERGHRAALVRGPAGTESAEVGDREVWDIDLRTGRPDPALFPVADWRRSVLAGVQAAPPGYGDAAGLPALRRAIAAWVRRSRGVDADPAGVLITGGAQGAFDLCARALLSPGDVIAIEDPGYEPARAAFGRAGLQVVGVPVDDDGIVVAAIPASAAAVYVTPSHQSPLGVVLGSARRRELLELAERRNLWVMEDDYDTEYRYVDRPLEPLQRLGGAERVVYVGSFSKTLTPSLRLGFVVAGPEILERLVDLRRIVDGQPPFLTQAALADFIVSGRFERHLRRTRRRYAERRAVVLDRAASWAQAGLIRREPSCPAGLHIVVEPACGDVEPVGEQVRSQGVAISPASGPYLPIGFGAAAGERLDRGLDVVEAALAAAQSPAG